MAENKKKTAPSLEEQLLKKRQEELTAFQKEVQDLTEKYGYRLSPKITISEAGITPDIEILPTR